MASTPSPIDADVFVYYNYHSVPIPADKIEYLAKHITNELGQEYKRFFFCCDVRATPKEVLDVAELIPNSEICHLNYAALESLLCDRMKCHAKVFNTVNANIVLISEHGPFGGTLTHLARLGWHVTIFYPPNTNSSFLDYADKVFALPIHRNAEETTTASASEEATTGVQEWKIASMAEDVKQGLTQLLNRLSGAIGPSVPEAANQLKPTEQFNTDNYVISPATTPISGSEVGENFNEDREAYQPEDHKSVFRPQAQIVGTTAFNPHSQPFIHPASAPVMNEFNTHPSQPVMMDMQMPDMNQPNPFAARVQPAAITPEKRNPFQRPNPFESQPHPPSTNNQDGRYMNNCEQELPFKTRIGGQRNPFASGPPLTAKHSNNNGSGGPKEFRHDFNNYQAGGGEGREKFRKPAPQCPHWEDKVHKDNANCTLWHPYKMCTFFPQCRTGAYECGYAHPFCSQEDCSCNEKDPQLNHFEERAMY